jgi:hypothetical protein
MPTATTAAKEDSSSKTAKITHTTSRRDFLEGALTKAGLLSAKR